MVQSANATRLMRIQARPGSLGQQLLSGRSEASVTEPASADRAAAEGDG